MVLAQILGSGRFQIKPRAGGLKDLLIVAEADIITHGVWRYMSGTFSKGTRCLFSCNPRTPMKAICGHSLLAVMIEQIRFPEAEICARHVAPQPGVWFVDL